jgi:tRNA(Ile)-lysidine synthase
METDLFKKITDTIEKHRMIRKNEKIILGLSGGMDSVFLFHYLMHIKSVKDISVYCIHINHKLRGVESDKDSDFVKKLCESNDIPVKIIKKDIKGYADSEGMNLEDAGRKIRYQEFSKFAGETGRCSIATAHHRDDNIETILMNINRGCGNNGLMGIPYTRDNIIRPLLDITKAEISDYLKENNLEHITDKSNKDNKYTRNRIRNSVIPHIKKEMGDRFFNNLMKLSAIIEEEEQYWKNTVRNIACDTIKSYDKSTLVLDRNKLKDLDLVVQKRLIRYIIERLKGDIKDIESVHVESIIDLINNKGTNKRVILSGDLSAENVYDDFKLSFKANETDNKKRKICIENIKNNNEILDKIKSNTNDSFIQYFDSDKVGKNLLLRKREPGDRIKPLGCVGSKKVKDYLIDKKIPTDKRNGDIIMTCDKGIIWIVGHIISDNFKVTKKTKNIIKIEVI